MTAAPAPHVVAVCGSRTWRDPDPIRRDLVRLRALHGDRLVVVHGHCLVGADAVADGVAGDLGAAVVRVPAQWETHDRDGVTPVPCRCSRGKRVCREARDRRNQLILDAHQPRLVLAYRMPGRSPDTDDMVARALAAGIEVLVVGPEGALLPTPTSTVPATSQPPAGEFP